MWLRPFVGETSNSLRQSDEEGGLIGWGITQGRLSPVSGSCIQFGMDIALTAPEGSPEEQFNHNLG